MTALESIASYLVPQRQDRRPGPSKVERALAAADDLIDRLRNPFQGDSEKSSLDARRRF